MRKTIFFNDNDGAHHQWEIEVNITILKPSEYAEVYFCWDDLNEDKNKGNIAYTSLDVKADGKPYLEDKVLSYTDWDIHSEGPICVHYWWYKKLFPCSDPTTYSQMCDLEDKGLLKETDSETLIFKDYNSYKTWKDLLPDGYPGK